MNRSIPEFFPVEPDRSRAISAGFRFGHIGTHTSRTMMLDDLATVLDAVPADGGVDDYGNAIVEENCLGKSTVATRRLSFQRLRELYGLDPGIAVFRILRRIWAADEAGRPVVALMAALARDPLLLATAGVILAMPEGSEFQRTAMREAIAAAVGERLNESTLDKVVRNAASSWEQSGHLEGRTFKFRRKIRATPGMAAFGLYLAHAAGFPLEACFATGWLRLLDCGTAEGIEMALAAKRQGFLDIRMAGDVVDLNLSRLDPLASELR